MVFSRTEGKRWIYIDGELQGDPIDQSSVQESIDNDNPLAIGKDIGGGAGFFTGVIDEVGFFNVALSAAYIKSLQDGAAGLVAAVSPSGNLTTTWGEIKR